MLQAVVMAFFDVASLRNDSDFTQRVTACASIEGKVNDDGVGGPETWVIQRLWQISSAPGFGDKYAAAVLNQVPRPGQDQSVISDADILAVVQPMD